MRDIDKNLWNAFIQGDESALNSIYQQYVQLLYAFGARFCDDAELIKDCIHDLFVDLYKYRATLSADVSVKSYLFTSLKRKILLVLKKQSSREDRLAEIPFSLSYDMEDRLAYDDEQCELLSQLSKHLDLLPSRQKEALYLRFNSELEYEEIAVIMNVSLGTCRTLVYRGVKQLRERMEIKHLYKIMA